jgi:hypothetical protein
MNERIEGRSLHVPKIGVRLMTAMGEAVNVTADEQDRRQATPDMLRMKANGL